MTWKMSGSVYRKFVVWLQSDNGELTVSRYSFVKFDIYKACTHFTEVV